MAESILENNLNIKVVEYFLENYPLNLVDRDIRTFSVSSSEIEDMRFESTLIEFRFRRDQTKAGMTTIELNATSIDVRFRKDSMQFGISSRLQLLANKE